MATADPQQVVVTMTKERETPGTWRFSEGKPRGEAVIGTLYMPKDALKQLGDPNAITVKITPA